MKKNVFLGIIFGFFAVSLNAQQHDILAFADQYKKKEGFTVVSLGRATMKILSLIAKSDKSDENGSEFLSKVKSIKIITSDPMPKNRMDDFVNDVVQFCQIGKLEKLIEVDEPDSSVNIYCRLNDDEITELIILNVETNSVDAIFIKGNFSFDDISNAASKNPRIIK